jgi:manganese efflux pump family protein
MLTLLFVSALLSSLDNLVVCSAIGLLPLTGVQRRWYSFTFSLAETLAPVAGMSIGAFLWPSVLHRADQSVPAILLLCGATILALAWLNRDAARFFGKPGMIVGLPLLMSLDNLIAGIGLGAVKSPPLLSALIIGVAGSIMSCSGLFLGDRLRHALTNRVPQFTCGSVVCLVSRWMLVRG